MLLMHYVYYVVEDVLTDCVGFLDDVFLQKHLGDIAVSVQVDHTLFTCRKSRPLLQNKKPDGR